MNEEYKHVYRGDNEIGYISEHVPPPPRPHYIVRPFEYRGNENPLYNEPEGNRGDMVKPKSEYLKYISYEEAEGRRKFNRKVSNALKVGGVIGALIGGGAVYGTNVYLQGNRASIVPTLKPIETPIIVPTISATLPPAAKLIDKSILPPIEKIPTIDPTLEPTLAPIIKPDEKSDSIVPVDNTMLLVGGGLVLLVGLLVLVKKY
jgi:hypothetical protein